MVCLHELGIMIHIVETIENYAKQNSLTKIDTLVLLVGELSPVVPRYIEACYPAAIDGTMLEDTKLKIEILPGNAVCKTCNKVFNVMANHRKCPYCQASKWEAISGREFLIKEIIAC